MPIRLMENFRAVFYAPYYATYALGFYAREGVEVELMTSDAPGDAVPKLTDHSIDITWGGPMRVMKAHDQDKHSSLVSFCEVVSHDPFFLIGKAGSKPFRLSDLAQMKFASVSEVPTPWMCLQHDLRESHIAPDKLPRIVDRAMGRNYNALKAGDLDVMQAFEPFVSMAEQDKAGDVLYAASRRGPTAYTAFIATREACATYREEFAAMTRATAKMLGWVYANPADELATAVSHFFPDVPKAVLTRSLSRYREAGLWSRETAMNQQGFTRLADSLHSGGFITNLPRYDECVELELNEIRPGS
ncbi:ABC transporter substrate-binding protein [Rhodoplanes sp. Z2-YC6860]|uniref:ABC transporter substrate-binding protein n=1 Tax=Rhodoplanes sp. Z2-YC6860 TaxID=674703 RepID=UPI00078E14BE|nr:ABC transporter substrate-binding protein [Rhodoplanes sp. Z2-YC6860]AMN38655.1 nitrate/sulfonate/bicarbonate ABC transporter substrate-binding protein [Rhodoplanes sp. Z2-YC6860]